MKRIISLLVALVMVFSAFGVCTTDDVSAASKKNKIEVTKVTVSGSGVKVKIKITSYSKKEISWGNDFGLERYENGTWQKLTMREEAAWDDIAFCLAISGKAVPNNGYQGYHTYSLTSLYNKQDLIPGKYRICMSINFKKADRYAEFTIPEYQKIKLTKNTTVKVNKGTVLKLKINTTKDVKWTTSNKKIATVSKKGVVTTKKSGTVKIKVKYGKKVLKCTIKVTNKSRVDLVDVLVTDTAVNVKVKYINNGKKEIFYGNSFHVERYENGQWNELVMLENVAFTMEARVVPAGESVYDTYSLAYVYGREQLTPGKYRICTSASLKKADRYVEFTIS